MLGGAALQFTSTLVYSVNSVVPRLDLLGIAIVFFNPLLCDCCQFCPCGDVYATFNLTVLVAVY